MTARALPALVAWGLLACQSDKPAAPAPAPAPAAQPKPVAGSAEPGRQAAGGRYGQVMQHLADEKSNRPGQKPTADDVFAALQAAGVAVRDRKQVVGATVKARYCESAKADGLALSVCEYGSPAEAQAGVKFVLETFAALQRDRVTTVHGATTLAITATAGHEQDREKAIAAFRRIE